jgi:hypothetical protein
MGINYYRKPATAILLSAGFCLSLAMMLDFPWENLGVSVAHAKSGDDGGGKSESHESSHDSKSSRSTGGVSGGKSESHETTSSNSTGGTSLGSSDSHESRSTSPTVGKSDGDRDHGTRSASAPGSVTTPRSDDPAAHRAETTEKPEGTSSNDDTVKARPGRTGAATVLAGLKASTSPTSRSAAPDDSLVEHVVTYETEMREALRIGNPAKRAEAILEARDRLADAADRPLPPQAVVQVDRLLGLPTGGR